MRFWRRFKFIFQFRQSIPFLKEYFLSRQVKLRSKMIAIGLILVYVVFPFDLLPDFFLIIGLFDDIMIASLILQQIVKRTPTSIKEEYHLL
ncbi:YkvA family protein [Paraliobacillus zengyii]|uniref:YkvA family protein n=1 Tax=Paraliobacillus zengyii TaxID=2213194 RepID=UPI000E3EA1C0|nr:DUF1232 domain-containing protein [Paraliobacillus zengyii]